MAVILTNRKRKNAAKWCQARTLLHLHVLSRVAIRWLVTALQAPELLSSHRHSFSGLQWTQAAKRPLSPPSQRLQAINISPLWGFRRYQSLVTYGNGGVAHNKALLLPRATSSHKVYTNHNMGSINGRVCSWLRLVTLRSPSRTRQPLARLAIIQHCLMPFS